MEASFHIWHNTRQQTVAGTNRARICNHYLSFPLVAAQEKKLQRKALLIWR